MAFMTVFLGRGSSCTSPRWEFRKVRTGHTGPSPEERFPPLGDFQAAKAPVLQKTGDFREICQKVPIFLGLFD
jgi:hypothetical protein